MSSHQLGFVSSQVEGQRAVGIPDTQAPNDEVVIVADEGNILEINAERIEHCPYFEHLIPNIGERSSTWDLMKKLNAQGVVNGCVIGDFNFFLSNNDKTLQLPFLQVITNCCALCVILKIKNLSFITMELIRWPMQHDT
jgi:hypothetical protein